MKPLPIHVAFLASFNKIENAVKDSNNPHFKSKYANLEAVIDQIKPALKENSLFFIQTFKIHEVATIMELSVWNEVGESIALGCISLPVINKDNPQALKSSITLLRRAQLLAAFGMAEVDDDDGNEAAKEFKPLATEKPKEVKEIKNHAPQASANVASPAQQNMFWGKIEEHNWPEKAVKELFLKHKVESFEKATKQQASKLIEDSMKGPELALSEVPF